MIKQTSSKSFRLTLILAILLPLAAAGCSRHYPVTVPALLTPLADASTPDLIAEVNRVAAISSIHGKIDIQFQDTSFASAGIAEKYRTAGGTITLQRPGKVYLDIQVPLLATDVAQMTSDGEHFRVAILQGEEKYRRFVRGTNSAVYPRLKRNGAQGRSDKAKKGQPDKRSGREEEEVSTLQNLRPQHLTDAMLMRPIQTRAQPGLTYARSEFYEEEKDPKASKKRVVRGYYLLDELAPDGDSGARVLRRFWFDRVGGIRLARLQTFDQSGALLTDVTYAEAKNFGTETRATLPSKIELTRPQDSYKLSLTYQDPGAVVLNHPYDPEVFVLENRWQLPEVDLDQQLKSHAATKP